MQNIEIDLTVGQTVRVGDKTVTILKIENDEIFFQIDSDSEGSLSDLNAMEFNNPACDDNFPPQKRPPK